MIDKEYQELRQKMIQMAVDGFLASLPPEVREKFKVDQVCMTKLHNISSSITILSLELVKFTADRLNHQMDMKL